MPGLQGTALQTEDAAGIDQCHPPALLLLTFPPTKRRFQKSPIYWRALGDKAWPSGREEQAPFISSNPTPAGSLVKPSPQRTGIVQGPRNTAGFTCVTTSRNLAPAGPAAQAGRCRRRLQSSVRSGSACVLGAAGSGGAAKEAARNVLSKCKLRVQARDPPK